MKHYALTKNEHALVCTMNGTATTMTAALSIICKMLTSYEPPRRVMDMHEVIVNYFQWEYEEGMALIIDEAQELNDLIINELRHIYDECLENGKPIGLVLCGNAAFKNRFNHAEASAFAQVTSRIGIRADIQGPGEDDIETICDARKVFGSLERKYVLKHGRMGGGLRIVTKLINVASSHAEGNPITITHLRTAGVMMGLE
ncbi:MAG: hypothetical protein RIB59_11060 [Rhodospirillales bacterium]